MNKKQVISKEEIPMHEIMNYLKDACQYYKEENIDSKDWQRADEIYKTLLLAFVSYRPPLLNRINKQE